MTEISPAIIKKTQDTLGKFVKKPALAEKLLKKPPFKFLHDVINAVIKNTGFLDGLYTAEELQSDNIKDREAKIAFLQKTIDAVKLATNENLPVRPSKTVAGLEPEKTNELLQAIGKAIQNKVDSTSAVEAIKNGQAAPTEKKKTIKKDPKASTKVKPPNAETKVTKPKPSDAKKTTNDPKIARQTSKESKDLKRRDSKDSTGKKIERKSSENGKKSPVKAKSKEKRIEQVDPKKESETNKTNAELVPGDDRRTEKKDTSKPEAPLENNIEVGSSSSSTINNNIPDDKVKNTSEIVNSSTMNISDETHKPDTESNGIQKMEMKDNKKLSSSNENQTNTHLEKSKSNDKKSSARADKHKQETRKGEEARSEETKKEQTKKQDAITEDTELDKLTKTATKKSVAKSMSVNEELVQNMQPIRPTTALRSAAVRPVSARPGAPRRKDRNIKILEIENLGREVNDNANANKTNFAKELVDDGENLITIDDNIISEVAPSREPIASQNVNADDTKQGHLVQQILETQTVFSKIENEAKNDSTRTNDVMPKSMIERQLSAKKMSFLRESIQKLTRYITPLGKLMEYFQEDVDAMQIELSMWQNTYSALEMEIKNEQGQTEKLLEPFKYQLVGIENNIKDYREQINNLTANIIQNEEKILKLIVDL